MRTFGGEVAHGGVVLPIASMWVSRDPILELQSPFLISYLPPDPGGIGTVAGNIYAEISRFIPRYSSI